MQLKKYKKFLVNKKVQATYNIVYTKVCKIKSKKITNLTKQKRNSIMSLLKKGENFYEKRKKILYFYN